MILESVAAALCVHIGKKLIDRFWDNVQTGQTPAANAQGQITQTSAPGGRPYIDRNITVGRQPSSTILLSGRFFLTGVLGSFLLGNEVPVVLIFDQAQQQIFLFVADLTNGYQMELPPGIYSFMVFLMDSDAPDFYDAEISAVGLPSSVDISSYDSIELEQREDLLSLVDDTPINIAPGAPVTLDFVFVDPDLTDFPETFAEFMGEESAAPLYDLTGTWRLTGTYQGGRFTGDMTLTQVGGDLVGEVVKQDTDNTGVIWIVEEDLAGQISGDEVVLNATGGRVLRGGQGDYMLDSWSGTVENENRIRGSTQDTAGTPGRFVLERVYR